jgi:hypothetical protein
MVKKAITLCVFLLGTMTAPALAANTCSQGKKGCMNTGGDAQVCEQRRQSCMETGCWSGGLVQRCGYIKK